MSFPKRDRLFPDVRALLTEAELASMVAFALRQDYGDLASAVKHVGRQTGATLRAIKNWFQGKNAPSSSHLLILARISPSVLRVVLGQIGGSDLTDAFLFLKEEKSASLVAKNVPLNVSLKSLSKDSSANLNDRQLWFLRELGKGNALSATKLSLEFGVSTKTARRDIKHLKRLGRIRFLGAKKRGQYELIEESIQ